MKKDKQIWTSVHGMILENAWEDESGKMRFLFSPPDHREDGIGAKVLHVSKSYFQNKENA